jgi:hypothetical protein
VTAEQRRAVQQLALEARAMSRVYQTTRVCQPALACWARTESRKRLAEARRMREQAQA